MQQRSLGEKIFLLCVSMLFAVVITFGLPKNIFLLSFYIVPIILAANYYGLVGGIGCAAICAVLAVSLARTAGILLEDTQVIAQIILYFLIGGFGGFMQRENVRIQKALQIASITDELTGLYNYQHFRIRLDEEVKRAKRYGHFLALLLCDVDNFKKYNDTFGHPNGNFVLNKMATLIKGSVRESDLSFRYGGDEFALILPETGANAEKIAERVITEVNVAFDADNIDPALRPGLTGGIVYSDPKNPLTASQLISMADHTLYEAKRSGKKVLLASPEETPQQRSSFSSS